jgi:hypothetical protein
MYTTYSTNASQTKMQAMSFLEDGNNITAYIPNFPDSLSIAQVSASSTTDYTKRYLVTQ